MSDTFWSNYNAGSRSVNDFADRLYQRQAAQSLAGGDYTSAMQNIARTGDLAKVGAVQDLQIERQKAERTNQEQAAARSAAFARQAAGALKSAVANGQDPLTAFDAMSPAMSQMGVTPEQQQEFRAALQANPAGLVQGIETWADGEERKLSFQKAGDRLLVFEEGNANPVRQFDAPARPIVSGGVSFDPTTGQPIADTRRPEYIEVEGADGRPQIVAVGSGGPQVVFEGEARGPAVTTLSRQEVESLGLQPGVYQRKADGTITAVSGQGGDRLSAGQQRQVEAYYQEIAGLDNIDAELSRFDRMIETGELELSPVANVIGGARNALGISSENSRNLAEFQATLERVRNDSLRLNKGVQTEGDAQRAWNELIANINDPAVVRRQLRRIQEINARARGFRQQRINALEGGGGQRAQQAAQPMPSVRFPPSSAQLQQWRALPRTGSLGSRTNPILINPESATQSFNNVPRGGYFITPDGQFLGPKP